MPTVSGRSRPWTDHRLAVEGMGWNYRTGAGLGTYRQNPTKSKKSFHVPLSGVAREVFIRRQHLARTNELGALFPSRTGTWTAVDRIEKAMTAFRSASKPLWLRLGIPLNEVTTHLMRRSAATRVERTYGLTLASALLGHSNKQVTRTHYVTSSKHVDVSAAIGWMPSGPPYVRA